MKYLILPMLAIIYFTSVVIINKKKETNIKKVPASYIKDFCKVKSKFCNKENDCIIECHAVRCYVGNKSNTIRCYKKENK